MRDKFDMRANRLFQFVIINNKCYGCMCVHAFRSLRACMRGLFHITTGFSCVGDVTYLTYRRYDAVLRLPNFAYRNTLFEVGMVVGG